MDGRRLRESRESKGYSVEGMAAVLHTWRRLGHLSVRAIEDGIRTAERGEAVRDAALAAAIQQALGAGGAQNPGASGANLLPRR
jgi:predicted transcriptional regulator